MANDDMVLPSARLRDLARDLARLAPSRTNPHAEPAGR
jgi:hypothetical protein